MEKFNLKFFINIFCLILIIFLTGCSNRYYFKKNIDNFNPNAKDKFSVSYNTKLYYEDYILSKLKEKISTIPLNYSINPSVPYLVYFDYKKRYWFFPVFRVMVVYQNNKSKDPDVIVYEAKVFSYNTNLSKSIIASLKILTNDLVNREYSKNGYIKMPITKVENNNDKKDTHSAEEITIPSELPSNKNTQYLKYRLYSKDEYYKK